MKTIVTIGKICAAAAIAVGIAAGAHGVANVAVRPVIPPSQAPMARPASAPSAPISPAAPAPDLGTMLAAANPDAGKAYAKTCAACHSFDKGAANKVGPNLYGIIGAKHAHAPDFKYSDAMKAANGKIWTFEALDEFLRSPKTAIPGNRMAFAGIKSDKDRMNVIVWLHTLSDKPEPLPAPKK